MKNKVLAFNIDKSFFQEKFEYLNDKYDILGCYASWNPLDKKLKISKKDRIKIELLYDKNEIFNSYPIKRISCLDTEFLSKMYECESYFFDTVDRCSALNQPVGDLKFHYNELLRFYKSFFEQRKDITHIFFPTTPHFPIDIVLYFVSKYFGLKTIILNRVDFNNKFYFKSDWRIAHDFDHKFKYKKTLKIEYKDLLSDSKFITTAIEENNTSLRNFKRRENILTKIIDHVFLVKNTLYYYRNKRLLSPFHFNKRVNVFKVYLLVLKRYFLNKRLVTYYSRNMTIPNLEEKKFIYFPLHFQPERSTDPEGIFFSNQLRAIELIANNLPQNYYLYVKEHPRQFDPIHEVDLRKLYSRSLKFYSEISNLQNTVLVNINIDSKILIKKSTIVATITGSSGWEAISINKPTIVFGKPWYSNFKNCFKVETKKDLIKALKSCKKLDPKSNKKEMKLNIDMLQNKIFEAYIGEMYHDGTLTFKKIVENFSTNFMVYIKNAN